MYVNPFALAARIRQRLADLGLDEDTASRVLRLAEVLPHVGAEVRAQAAAMAQAQAIGMGPLPQPASPPTPLPFPLAAYPPAQPQPLPQPFPASPNQAIAAPQIQAQQPQAARDDVARTFTF